MPGESTAYVACPLCAKHISGSFPGFLCKAKETWKGVFLLPLAPPPKPTQLESLNQEMCPDTFCKSYVLLDNNHLFNTAEKSREPSIFAMASQSIQKTYLSPKGKTIWKSSHDPDFHIELALLSDQHCGSILNHYFKSKTTFSPTQYFLFVIRRLSHCVINVPLKFLIQI